ncbi:MAG: methyltransferase domain-containing protein [Elusimicrobia bacterium]|nr:methyltransferase domain-containing protein [Elusimicrobiota bacterium]
MKPRLLTWLSSPCCAMEMKFAALEKYPTREVTELQFGSLACRACGKEYPIRGGIPRLLGPGQDRRDRRTAKSFAWEWMRYPGSFPEDRAVFLAETQLPAEAFAGKLVLDAGCGMGRYALEALSLGAEVVALDLSESLERLRQAAEAEPRLHLVQGDLLRLPLKKGAFDIVYSQGVLHHAPGTGQAFRQVAQRVRPGGFLSVWVYGKAGKFEEFATNPIREDRAWVRRRRRLAWVIVTLRHWISDFLRMFTTRLPIPLLYVLCFPLALAGALPGIKYLTFSVHPRFRVRLIENFDWLAPPYQYHHTKEELASWFVEAGFDPLKILAHGLVPKPGILGRKHG